MAHTTLIVKLDSKEVGDALVEAARKLCGNPTGGAEVVIDGVPQGETPGAVLTFQFQPKRAL